MIIKKRNIRAFTLVEVMIAMIISGMMSVFVYIMVTTSYEYYNRLNSDSKFSNNLRFLTNSLRVSMTYASNVSVSSNKLIFSRKEDYDIDDTDYKLDTIREEYYFTNGTRFKNNGTYSIALDTNTATFDKTRGVFFKDTYVNGTLKNRILMANNIRTIFYTITSNKLNLGIVYDEVVDGKVLEDGSITGKSDGMTSFTINGKVLCFTSRSM